MSGFVIRTVATTASGREIVRARVVSRDTLSVGRDPASDIHLADLAAAPHHATLTLTGPTTVRVEAAPGLRVTIARHAEASHMFDAAEGGELRIGRQQLTIGYEDGDVVVEVRSVPDAEVEYERRFTLASVGPSKRAMSWIALALVLIVFLAWPLSSFFGSRDAKAFEPQSAMSAGPLSAGHARLSKDCKACHVKPFVAVADTSCKSCHKGVHDHADPTRLAEATPSPGGIAGLKRHVAIAFGRSPGRCVDCHSEHHGPTRLAATPQAFCSDCHADLKAQLPDTKLANAGDFATAHPQFMPAVVVTPGDKPVIRRISFDAKPVDNNGLTFPHALHLASSGNVARMAQTLGRGPVACASCHRADASRVRFEPVDMERDCQACHVLDAGRVAGVARTIRHGDTDQAISDALSIGVSSPAPVPVIARTRPGDPSITPFPARRQAGPIAMLFGPGGTCRECHQVTANGRFGVQVVPVKQQTRYLKGGWFDHNAHRATKCADCHNAQASQKASDLLVPGIANCRTCHGGGEAKRPKVQSTCAMCHDYHRTNAAPRESRRDRRRLASGATPLRLDWKG